jgi:hypothetical protein
MEARRGVQVWLYSVLTLAPDGVGAQCHAPAALPTGRGRLHRGEEAGLATRQVGMGFAPTGDRHSDRPACIESLYRLRYQRIESNEKFFLHKFYLVQFSELLSRSRMMGRHMTFKHICRTQDHQQARLKTSGSKIDSGRQGFISPDPGNTRTVPVPY